MLRPLHNEYEESKIIKIIKSGKADFKTSHPFQTLTVVLRVLMKGRLEEPG